MQIIVSLCCTLLSFEGCVCVCECVNDVRALLSVSERAEGVISGVGI